MSELPGQHHDPENAEAIDAMSFKELAERYLALEAKLAALEAELANASKRAEAMERALDMAREAIRDLAHGKHSGRAHVNRVLLALAAAQQEEQDD